MADTTVVFRGLLPTSPIEQAPGREAETLRNVSAPARKLSREFSHEDVLAIVKEHGVKPDPIKLIQAIECGPLDKETRVADKAFNLLKFSNALYRFEKAPIGLDGSDEANKEMIAKVRGAFQIVDSMFKIDQAVGRSCDGQLYSKQCTLEKFIARFSPKYSNGEDAEGLEACRNLRVIYLEKLVGDKIIDNVSQLGRALGQEGVKGEPNFGLSAKLGEVIFCTEHPGIKKLADEFEREHQKQISSRVKSNQVNGKPAWQLDKWEQFLSVIGAPIRWIKGEK